jgi:hypothetical protein
MTDLLVIVLGLTSLWLLLKLYGKGKHVKRLEVELSDQRGINAQLNLQIHNQQQALEQPEPEVYKQLDAANHYAGELIDRVHALRRTVANLQGQITKLKRKK